MSTEAHVPCLLHQLRSARTFPPHADKLGEKAATDLSLLSVRKLNSLYQKSARQQEQMEKRLVMAQKSTMHLKQGPQPMQSHDKEQDPLQDAGDVSHRCKVRMQ